MAKDLAKKCFSPDVDFTEEIRQDSYHREFYVSSSVIRRRKLDGFFLCLNHGIEGILYVLVKALHVTFPLQHDQKYIVIILTALNQFMELIK